MPAKHHFLGSNQARALARHDLFGYISHFGALQVFFTISPYFAGTYIISVNTGILDEDKLILANSFLLPNRNERRLIAANNPMQCALYFDRVIEITIGIILAWDTICGRPKRQGGIFGITRAFAAWQTCMRTSLFSFMVFLQQIWHASE